MLNKIRNRKGFTLIELLIVVAIIGILAAIAIPQFSAYRMRGYNSTALSDMKNAKTAQESLYADSQCYGENEAGAAGALLTVAAPASGAGNVLQGPIAAAVGGAAPVAGGRFAGVNASVQTGAIPVGLSNGVNLRSVTSADAVSGQYNSYLIFTRHEQADTAYASDSDNTTVTYRVVNSQWPQPANVNTITATMPAAPLIGVDDLNGFNGGGLPTPNWTIM
jgi:prepilin-type N-terminal cleavage/methylation domain-containing protein